MHLLSKKWRRCSSTTCPGSRWVVKGHYKTTQINQTLCNSRCNFWKRLSTYFASAARLSCTHTCLRITWKRTINPWYSRIIKRTWSRQRRRCPSIWNVILHPRIWLILSRKCKINTGEFGFAANQRINRINRTKPNNLPSIRYCEKRCSVLLKHVHEGYDKDWWEYTEWRESWLDN